MENLLKELEIIESEHRDFFEKNDLKLFRYISISKAPVMLRFNERMDIKHRLPKEVYEKTTKLLRSYYGM